ncbi:MAG: glyoxalase [Planctomycetes bacterium SM23_32]|nr:MAG: glyoxalase [Planctomycetes bacterium SM23_32]
MPRVVHFDISADDPERAATFYREVFGWRITKWQGPLDYWLVETGDSDEPCIGGGIARREKPSDGITNIIDVPSADEFAARVASQGGRIIKPKSAVPGVGYLVTCEDTEGNAFGIMESDEGAG